MSRLENWYIVELGTEGNKSILIGKIYDDNRFEDGKTIRTSLIQHISEENKIARTLNTTYELGNKLYK